VGIVGTGFVARGVYRSLLKTPGVNVTRILTRRDADDVEGMDPDLLTDSLAELVDSSDLIFESSGDAIHATEVLEQVMAAGIPVVTMNSELHVTTGSWLARRGYITEADGDQPGCHARLKLEAEVMGFTPLAYVNIKGYLNNDPCTDEMEHWAATQCLRLDQVVSFTDGSKLHIEQALVANGLDADIACDGMLGRTVPDLRATGFLGALAEQRGRALSDYILCPGAPPGVFIVARHEEFTMHGDYGPFAKLRTIDGEYGILLRPHHLIHLEVPRTILKVIRGEPPLLNNSILPRIGVAAIAKRPLKVGTRIARGLGGFEVRGSAVEISAHPSHVPLCLLANAVVRRKVGPEQVLSFDDIELPETRALAIYRKLLDEIVASGVPPQIPGTPAATPKPAASPMEVSAKRRPRNVRRRLSAFVGGALNRPAKNGQ
jgi:predicted homoserine dehydrogenase-like protein